MPIPDEGVLTIGLDVSGLLDNNLASPTQGICGIEIDFMHDYIWDLTVSLVSPSGTIVQLIGPTSNTHLETTNLTNWDIDFVSCGSPADPDPGFADVWDNDQPWTNLTPYTGTYHPYMGCLENFNTGPANGLWQLIFEDHDQFQLGIVDSITLIFCNPAGLICTCNPNAGNLTPTNFIVCSGENIQSSDISIDFGSNVPSPASYSYEYLLVSGNTILQNGASFSISPPAGSYSICGLSYLTADTTTVNALLDDGDYALLQQAIQNGIICGDLTADCIALEVSEKPDTIAVNGGLCNGEVFTYRGQHYTTAGVFYQVGDGPGLCDTVHQISLFPRTLSVSVDPADTLTCGNGSLDLQATASGSGGPFTYLWSTTNGNIITAPTLQTIGADQPGQYFVEISDGICSGTGSVLVHADLGFPQVFFDGGTLSCTNPLINIEPIFIPTGGSILWTGPPGFIPTSQPNISVTIPGTYHLMVTNNAGCTTTRSVDIPIDTATNPIDIYILEKDCIDGTVVLADLHPEWLRLWDWTGPNMFTSTYWRPEVSDPGLYSLTGTFHNGCTRTGNFFFDGDFTVPDITVPAEDTLNCNEIISLAVSSTTPGVSYSWTGPNSFFSSQQTIMVSQEGVYTGMVVAPNGCFQSGDVVIARGDDIFSFDVFTDTITCSRTLVVIGVNAPEADFYDWLNYSGPGDDGPMIEVSAGGVYRVLMRDTDTNCEVLAEIQVYTDMAVPYFEYNTDTVTCNEQVAELNFVPVAGYTYTSVYWELPDFTVVNGPTLMSGLPGEHRLYASGPNGCAWVRHIHIPFDTIRPFVILESDTLQCADTVTIISQSLDSVTAYQWSGPGIINTFGETIEVNIPGWYHLSAYGVNGCPAEHDVLVDSNFVKPSFVLMADSLRCDMPADLVVIPMNPVISYLWFDTGGAQISTDSLIIVNQPGSYRVEVQGQNLCIAYDTVILEPVQYPSISLDSDTITCASGTATVNVDIDISQYTLAWVDVNNDTISMAGSLSVTHEGPFIASVSGLNACETRDTILVPFDTIAPVAVITLAGKIKCQNRDVVLDALASTPQSLSYSWSTPDGQILSDPGSIQIDVRDTGIYFLAIQQQHNGCVDSSFIILTEDPTAITLAYLDIAPPECSGDEDASIQVTGLEGGVGPFQYQLDNHPFQSSPFFDELGAGTFIVTIADNDDCVFDTTVVIDPTSDFTVDAGPDQEIYLGEMAELSGTTSLSPIDIMTDSWSSGDSMFCADCPLFEFGPLESTSFIYQVISETGCIKEDEVMVYVLERGKFFIPNIFSPNGDDINDKIRIHASPGIERVLQWVIFDRWGNAAYGKTDFDPSDSDVFWNGQTSTGDFVNPGVFAYMLEIQLINGKIEVHHGDITVIR